MASWNGWNKMPTGSTQVAPAASGSVNVFARGDDHYIYHSGLIGGSWSGWKALGGLQESSAPATTVQFGNVYVFARRDDGHIFYTRWNGAGADGWNEVPGGETTTSTPGVAPGVLVVRRSDGGIRFNTFDGAGPVLSWANWRDVPDEGRTPSAPDITDFGAGYFLFVRGTDDGIHYKSLGADRASWGAWQKVPGGLTPDAPAVARGLVVVRGTDDRLYYNSHDGGLSWTGWQTVEGQTYSAPALTHAGGYFALVVRGTDDGIHYAFYD
ncbi:hypothetical protein [Streptomyces sp. NPDC000618]|uniref:hypothetical protein n=1 Tax=Streptomyces sp. NPDC000618 TaxID=3154265 RepID=UPI0033232B1D